jgi:hypothetical protein
MHFSMSPICAAIAAYWRPRTSRLNRAGDLHRPSLAPVPFLRTQHALSCFVEHDPHHLISAARYDALLETMALTAGIKVSSENKKVLSGLEI